jgi:hypothetical protein
LAPHPGFYRFSPQEQGQDGQGPCYLKEPAAG